MLDADAIQREIDEIIAHGDNRADIATLADLFVCLNAMSKTAVGLSDVEYKSDTEFAQAIQGKDMVRVLTVIDEAMTAVKTLLPRLYDGIMEQLEQG